MGLRQAAEELLARAGITGAKRSAIVAAAVIAAVALGASLAKGGTASRIEFESSGPVESVDETAADGGVTADTRVVVHVAGAVQSPGVYELTEGARVDDAIRAAGGGVGDAAMEALNLARVLTDGEQVYVPTTEEASAGALQLGGGGGASVGGAGLVNINTASAAELDALPGVGPSTAQKIVDDRTSNGPFATVDDLMRVSGLGAKKVDGLRDLVTTR